jgi:hypothetical protein
MFVRRQNHIQSHEPRFQNLWLWIATDAMILHIMVKRFFNAFPKRFFYMLLSPEVRAGLPGSGLVDSETG